MRILIGGGGTGGHIYPGLALARYAMEQDSANDVLFVGSAGGLESSIVPAAGFPLVTIPARGFKRNFKQIVSASMDLAGGIIRSGRVISNYKPDVVLGTGGYVAAPLVLSALLKRLPVVLHEQNALPGMTNLRLAPLVKKVCVSFEEAADKMPRSSRVVFTGNPRASEVAVVSRRQGRSFFGLEPDQKVVLVFGGSRGALQINRVMTAYLKEGLLSASVILIYVTGEIYHKEVCEKLGTPADNVRLFSYLDRMPEALAAADLAVTRSGATTLAELTALGVPALLVPSPNVAHNHQYHNARLLSGAGAAVLVEEKDFDHLRLGREIDRLMSDTGTLARMSEKSKNMGVRDAAERLYRCLREAAL